MDQIVLDGGLDLVRARPATPPGKLQACLNYEVGWRRGYSRIDGFERYDGSTSPSSTTGWVLDILKTDLIPENGQFWPVTNSAPEDLIWSDGDVIGSAGVLVDVQDLGESVRLFIVFRTGRVRPYYGVSIVGDKSGVGFDLTGETVNGVLTFPQFFQTHGEYQNALAVFAETLRNDVRPVPGTGTIVGLHYHEDALYAIRDTLNFTVSTSNITLEPGMYVYNDRNQVGIITDVGDNNSASVAAVDEDGFELTSGEKLHLCLSLRFGVGSGTFLKNDAVRTAAGLLGEVAHVSLRDGGWEAGNATGVAAFFNVTAGFVSNGDIITNDFRDGEMTANKALYQHQKNVVTIDEVRQQSREAMLWKSTDDGWVPAPIGGVLQFSNADTPIGADEYVRGMQTKYPLDTDGIGGGSADRFWANRENIKLDDGNVATVNFPNPVGYELGTADVRVDALGFQLSDQDEIVGFSVEIHGEEKDPLSSNHFNVWLYEGYGSSNKRIFKTDDFNATLGKVRLFAGDDPAAPDLAGTDWSIKYDGNPPPSEVRKSTFGFAFSLRVDPGDPDWETDFELDSVRVTVFFDSPVGGILYLYDGTNDIGYVRRNDIPIASFWDTPNAGADGSDGYVRVSDWEPFVIPAGLEIRTQPNGGGAKVGLTKASGVDRVVLPGSLALNEERSRYQMISYNFYASEDKNAIYGCSGAGPAFTYDGEVLQYIYTGMPTENEKPRHLAPHEFRLALGYQWGELLLSEPGEPTQFLLDGTGFAASFGFGDKITGLMPAAGNALAVFTESTTNALVGAPGDDSNPVQQRIINHKIGAIEYTVQSIGNRPIFASFRGVETMETMDEYSDFFTAPMTYDISPWLLDRLQTAAGLEATDKSVVNSVVVRNKNQYRLFFADGYLMTLTLVSTEREPQNTIQRYWFESDWRRYARIFATASGVSTDGRDRAFFSVEERPESPEEVGVAMVAPGEVDYVYEIDRGRSFDGGEIIAELEMTHNFGTDPQQGQPAPMATERNNVFHVHGYAHAYASLHMSRASNYEFMDNPVLPYEPIEMGTLNDPPEDMLNPKYTKGRLTERGFAVTFHVKHVSKIEFPHVLQLITLLDNTAMKQNR